MDVTLTRISGWTDAIATMFISKGNLTTELFSEIDDAVRTCTDGNGFLRPTSFFANSMAYRERDAYNKLVKWLNTLTKISTKHITLLKFLDFGCLVQGLHRAGQDDWDAHAVRYNNRIIRQSSRIGAAMGGNSLSDFYKDKVKLVTELADDIPEFISNDEGKWILTPYGYVKEEYTSNFDVVRGLYPLGLSSTFLFACNITEYSHVYKERNKNGGANPEVKELAETIADLLEEKTNGFINRDLLLAIKN